MTAVLHRSLFCLHIGFLLVKSFQCNISSLYLINRSLKAYFFQGASLKIDRYFISNKLKEVEFPKPPEQQTRDKEF